MSYPATVLADSPVIYLRLDETSGTSATDSSGNANTGTYVNATGYTQSQASLLSADSDLSVKFIKANSGHIWVADANSLDLGDTFTLEAWIKLSALGQASNKGILSKQDAGYYMRVNTADKIALVKSQIAVVATQTTALASVGPHHVVWTKNGGTSILYLNGSAVGVTAGTPSTMTNNARRLIIAGDGTGDVASEFFDGWIDEVALYSTVLTATQVLNHFNAGTSPLPQESKTLVAVSRASVW